MKSCPFCKNRREGSGPCPVCGAAPETCRDDALFRPPEDGVKLPQETPPDFQVEELMRWKPSAEPESPGEEGTAPLETEGAEETGGMEESSQPLKKPRKRWKKLAVAAAVTAAAVAALVIGLWPQPQAMPENVGFYVKDQILMALPADGEPRQLAEYSLGMEYTLWTSPDRKTILWQDAEAGGLKLLSPEGNVTFLEKGLYAPPQFSKDGRYLYYSAQGEEGSGELYQYDLAEEKEQKVGPGSSEYLWEDGSLLAVYGESLTIYDAVTLEEKWSQNIPTKVIGFFGGKLYYLEQEDNAARLCSWQDGQTEVLLKDISEIFDATDGSLYLLCWTGEKVAVSDVVENDLGAEGETLMKTLEGMTMRTPNTQLYHFKDGALAFLGEDMRVMNFREKSDSVLVKTFQYQTVEETSFLLSEIAETFGGDSKTLQAQMDYYAYFMWPGESSVQYLAREGRLFSLPKDAPQSPDAFQIQGNRVCIHNRGEKASEWGLWVGKLEEDAVASEAFYPIPYTVGFALTSDEKLYYWTGDSDQFVGTLYEDGVPLVSGVNMQQVQFTKDGAVYFLTSNSGWELNRLYQGKMEKLASNVESFVAYTGEYALCLQNRQDSGRDLLRCESGNQTSVAVEWVDSLLLTEDAPSYLVSYYMGSSGSMDSSDVITDITG